MCVDAHTDEATQSWEKKMPSPKRKLFIQIEHAGGLVFLNSDSIRRIVINESVAIIFFRDEHSMQYTVNDVEKFIAQLW